MLYNVEKFTFKDLSVRSVKCEGVYWFCVRDLCDGLQICRTNNGVRDTLKGEKTRRFHVYVPVSLPVVQARETRVKDKEDYTKEKSKGSAIRELVFTDESGVYTLMLRSNKPEAEEFRHWVTSEVLPSIREVGSYTIPQLREQQQTDEGKQLTLFEEKPKTLTEQKISFEVFVKVEGGASTCITTNFPEGSDIQKVFAAWGNINEAVTNILPAKQ